MVDEIEQAKRDRHFEEMQRFRWFDSDTWWFIAAMLFGGFLYLCFV
jgi:hypothetical protein